MGLEGMARDRPDFNELANRIAFAGDNAHFLPQSSLCGGLADTISNYDYVGRISDDTEAVSSQVTEMLELVLRRSSERSGALALYQGASVTSAARELVHKYFEKGSNASEQLSDSGDLASSAISGRSASSSIPLLRSSQTRSIQPFGEAISSRTAETLRIGNELFPRDGPSARDPHAHKGQPVVQRRLWYAPWRQQSIRSPPRNSTEQASEMFGNVLSLIKALDAYAVDYDRLPGLHRPPWATRVAAYYDVAKWRTRPSWLPRTTSGKI